VEKQQDVKTLVNYHEAVVDKISYEVLEDKKRQEKLEQNKKDAA
jgi:hypothetical protein